MKIKSWGISLLWLGLGSSAFALNLKLSEVQSKLNRVSDSAISWQAAENDMTRLTTAEARHRMGAILPENFHETFAPAAGTVDDVTERAPSSWDWRNVNGTNFAAPVLNQARCGSCVAFAAIGALETQMRITRNTPKLDWSYSPQHLFSCGGGGCETGWMPYSAAEFLKTQGVPDENCFPYKSGALGEDLACSSSCADASKRSEKIVNYTMPSMFIMDPAKVKAAVQKGPLMTVMTVYEDFLFYKSGVYKHVTGPSLGGHAVTIMGYNDAEKAWLVKNSWGEEWGDKGYFKIAYDDTSGVGSQTWLFEVSKPEGYVSLGDLRDNTVVNGIVNLGMVSTLPGTQTVGWEMLAENSLPRAWGTFNADGRVNVDTSKFPDGPYTLVARAQYSNGVAESQPRKVLVLNGKFQGKLTFLDVQAGQTFTGDSKLHFEVQASPIPFTKVIFHIRNVATGEESIRATGVTYPKMQVGWRAQYSADGEYDLVLEGQIQGKTVYTTQPLRVNVKKSDKEPEEGPIG